MRRCRRLGQLRRRKLPPFAAHGEARAPTFPAGQVGPELLDDCAEQVRPGHTRARPDTVPHIGPTRHPAPHCAPRPRPAPAEATEAALAATVMPQTRYSLPEGMAVSSAA